MKFRKKWAPLVGVLAVAAVLLFLLYPRKVLSFLAEPSNRATEVSIGRDSIDGMEIQRLYGDQLRVFFNQTEDVRLIFCGLYGYSGAYTINHGESGKYTYSIDINRRDETELKNILHIQVDDQGYAYIDHFKYWIVGAKRSEWLAYLQEQF